MAERRKLLSIGEAAARLGVDIKTLRSWADKGLVPHVVLPSGYRRFDPEDIEQIERDMRREGRPKVAA